MIDANDSGKTIRAFIALAIDEPMRSRIVGVIRDLRGRVPGVRWVSEPQIHLTLRFLGQATTPVLDRLKLSLVRVVAACPPREVLFSELGVFPVRGYPRVLWLGMSLPPALFTLQSACESAAIAAGFPPEARPFRPHLTLGRWRARAQRPALPEIDLGHATLSNVILYRSDLRPSGAIYTPLLVFELGSVME